MHQNLTRSRLMTAFLVAALALAAAQAASEANPTSAPAPAPASTAPAPSAATSTPSPWESLTLRMQALEKSVQEAGEKAKASAERAQWIAVLTVLISGGVALLAQWILMGHQNRQNAQQARQEVSNSYAQWQLKQLCELYGPLRALLGQSNVLYRQMNALLMKREPAGFRFVDLPKDDFDGKVFQIKIGETWTRFRTVQHLDLVYGKGFGVEPLFDAVADVADRIAAIIQSSAGYAREEDVGLIEVMGRYLAHHVTLREVHARLKDPKPGDERYVNDDATFPTEIQAMVDKGFRALNGELAGWRSKGLEPPKSS